MTPTALPRQSPVASFAGVVLEDIGMQCFAFAALLCVCSRAPSVSLVRGLLLAAVVVCVTLLTAFGHAEAVDAKPTQWCVRRAGWAVDCGPAVCTRDLAVCLWREARGVAPMLRPVFVCSDR